MNKPFFALCLLTPAVFADQLSIPNTFVAGTPAKAAEVNENFVTLGTESNNQDTRIVNLEDGLSAEYSRVTDLENETNTQDTRIANLEIGANSLNSRVGNLENDSSFKEQLTCLVPSAWLHSPNQGSYDCLLNNGVSALSQPGLSQNQLSQDNWVPVKLRPLPPVGNAVSIIAIFEKNPNVDVMTCEVTAGWFDGSVGDPGTCIKWESGSVTGFNGTDHNKVPGWNLKVLEMYQTGTLITAYTRDASL